MAGLMGFLSDIDPTKVKKADESGVRKSQEAVGQAGAQGQALLEKRMAETTAPTVERVAGPQAGQIDTRFLEAVQARIPSGATALQGAGGAQVQAQRLGQEATGMLREAATGQAPSAAQLQQQAAFEQAIKAQRGAMAGQGYNPALARQAMLAGAELQAQQAQQAGILAAQEQAQARQQFAEAAQRGESLGLQQQELALRAAQGDVQAQLDLAKIQSQTLGQQAELQTRAGIAGAQIGAEQAGLQARLESETQKQVNDLAVQYMQAGLSAAEAQQKAELALFGAESERQRQIAAGRSQLIGGILEAAGTVGAGLV